MSYLSAPSSDPSDLSDVCSDANGSRMPGCGEDTAVSDRGRNNERQLSRKESNGPLVRHEFG